MNRFVTAALLLTLLAATLSCVRGESDELRRRRAIDLMNNADRLQKAEQLFEARDMYWKSIQTWPVPRAYYGLGNCYLSLGKYRRAEDAFRQAANASPGVALFVSQADYARTLAEEQEAKEE